jgi:anaphase-promoting complex subunit 6
MAPTATPTPMPTAAAAAAAAARAAAEPPPPPPAAQASSPSSLDRPCAALRSLAQDCIAKHLYTSAVFYADKLVVLSGGAPADVYLLAQAMYVARQPLRALALLKAPPAPARRHASRDQQPTPQPLLLDARFAYLAAKCAAAAGEWHEALALLGSEDGAAEAELEALEAAWAPALAWAAAQAQAGERKGDAGAGGAGAEGGGDDGRLHRDNGGGAPPAAPPPSVRRSGRSSSAGGGAAAAAAADAQQQRNAAGGPAAAGYRRRSSAGAGDGVTPQQQQHHHHHQQQQQPLAPPPLPAGATTSASGTEVALASAVCLLRGRGYLALDDRARAARWLRAALLRDPFNEEAFALLVDGALLPAPSEVELVLALPLAPSDEWLRLMYRARCKQYGPGQERELAGILDELERPYAPHGRTAAQAAAAAEAAEEAAAAAAVAPAAAAAAAAARGDAAATTTTAPPSAGGRQPRRSSARGGGPSAGGFASPPPPSHQPPPEPLPMMTPATADAPPPPARSAGTKRTQAKEAKPGGASFAAGRHRRDQPPAPPAPPLRGWGLGGCAAVLACRAARLLHLGRHAECYALTSALLARDPHAEGALPSHLAAALALGKKDELFLR